MNDEKYMKWKIEVCNQEYNGDMKEINKQGGNE